MSKRKKATLTTFNKELSTKLVVEAVSIQFFNNLKANKEACIYSLKTLTTSKV